MVGEFFEARIAPQWIEPWINFDVTQPLRTLLIGIFKRFKRSLLPAESDMDDGYVIARNMRFC